MKIKHTFLKDTKIATPHGEFVVDTNGEFHVENDAHGKDLVSKITALTEVKEQNEAKPVKVETPKVEDPEVEDPKEKEPKEKPMETVKKTTRSKTTKATKGE